ncbi:asparagine synthase (glutamine-hydrolyzing) [Gramella sp. GC03-9]|uniref:asparagine synthase (glutamine-hydrolyzing) n=1 Tax=Christiangramia oceanisediminis TaxID=2920386 RepID=A0A9X2I2U2_9FLAO|nr:asparagine synthase (glutamine-hydrolyzing) [Gramella oceanisediminis]MCP9198302.1 asparagine synthase (glutamine-hydrolyzing) [Gramella oceanisediminis]
MCGIAGIIGASHFKENMQKMLESMGHRGPDHSAIYKSKNCILGHNRLSIIDLSEDANQPFIDPTGRYHLVFNGEIYNYKELREEIGNRYQFRTSSDTEVLLASYIIYGKDCLEKLNGMFAFAIWDQDKKKVFAARDRFGVKPFYYSHNQGSFIFCSEIKAIHTIVNKVVNETAWANYFSYGSYGMPEETFYSNISQLPGGYFLEYQEGSLQKYCWYNFEKRIKDGASDSGSEAEIKNNYLNLLEDAIKLRFRADVQVGFNLSGGVDSSLLLALVNHLHPNHNIRAYTFYTGDERYDELPWVEQMIANTGNPLEMVRLNSAEVPQLAEIISDYQDEPFGGIPTLAYSKIFRQASEDGMKVLLDGQGMDEQWAGYDYYSSNTNNLIQGVGKESAFKPEVLSRDFGELGKQPQYPEPFSSRVQNLQYRDLFYTKLPRTLRFNDRVSMAASTELREPFLDYRLVEFAFGLPENMKIRGGVHKFLLREIVKEFVPFEVAEAPKRPLQTPQREWLGSELVPFVEQSLQDLKECRYAIWFDFDLMEREWKSYRKNEKGHSFFLWQWINTALLLKNYQ